MQAGKPYRTITVSHMRILKLKRHSSFDAADRIKGVVAAKAHTKIKGTVNGFTPLSFLWICNAQSESGCRHKNAEYDAKSFGLICCWRVEAEQRS
jgi:hypothetical protein